MEPQQKFSLTNTKDTSVNSVPIFAGEVVGAIKDLTIGQVQVKQGKHVLTCAFLDLTSSATFFYRKSN